MSTVHSSEFIVESSESVVIDAKPETRHPKPLGLYIHIPYCASRCHYCDFNTYRFDAVQAEQYLQGLVQEIGLRAAEEAVRGRRVCSIFFGGGTPSILEGAQIVGVLERCRAVFEFEDGVEITLEANPGTVDPRKLRTMREGGINRLSLGGQAAQDGLLRRIGRAHSAREAEQAFWMARDAGLDNINVDLMFGLPGQSLDDWSESLGWIIRLGPEHISAYGLILEEGTRLHREHRAGFVELPDEETEAAMYQMTLDRLVDAGFEQYEISNFARPGFRCRHNLVYWEHQEYLGFGAGAHSFLGGSRFYNELLPAGYLRAIRECGTAVAGGERLSAELLRSERLMLGLRLRAGLDLQTLAGLLGIEDLDASEQVKNLLNAGLLDLKEGRIQIAERGLLVANELITQLL